MPVISSPFAMTATSDAPRPGMNIAHGIVYCVQSAVIAMAADGPAQPMAPAGVQVPPPAGSAPGALVSSIDSPTLTMPFGLTPRAMKLRPANVRASTQPIQNPTPPPHEVASVFEPRGARMLPFAPPPMMSEYVPVMSFNV